jgi:hypothetical protein
MRRPSFRSIVAWAALALVVALVGCGGGSSTPSEDQLREAKKAGEEAAHEHDRVTGLQKQVRSLRHQVRHGSQARPSPSTPADVPSTEASSGVLRSFHVASNGVSCEIREDGALCTVESTGQTFAFEDGEPAQIESVTTLPPGLGELVPYGSAVAAGSISCEIPPSNVPRGITCVDSASGHGFEASRVSGRQSAY